MFARDTMATLKFKRQHVFEAICKLLLYYNYDDFELGKNKQFFESMEDYIKKGDKSKIDGNTILNSKINESSKGGVADIFFESDFKLSDENCKDGWTCDCEIISEKKSEEPSLIKKKQFILIQNKYYENEKSITKAYDVTQIYTKAEEFTKVSGIGEFEKKIVLMVNNKEALDQKITRSKNSKSDLFKDLIIYGVKQLEDWFRKLLNDLYETKTFEMFEEKRLNKKTKKPSIKPHLIPKFHQQVFTKSTLHYNREEEIKLFIWGAVPRSGKSYMIADFIAKNYLRPESDKNNDIVLILGAKSETECQFIEMFCKFSDFDDYGIISASSGVKKICNKIKDCDLGTYKEKNIYIFSQEWFKQGKIKTINENYGSINKEMSLDEMQRKLINLGKSIRGKKNKAYNKKQLLKLYTDKPPKSVIDQSSTFYYTDNSKTTLKQNILQQLCSSKSKKIDLFFDEIHKGGSTNNTENIIYSFLNANLIIDIFVMVTATFAKPKSRYGVFDKISNKGLKVIEWGYEDQQNMKQVTNNTNKDIMINSREGIEKEVIRQVFQKYKDEYGEEAYLKIISEEYEKHPQLVLIQPEQFNRSEYIDVRIIFDKILNCNACKREQKLADLKNPNIFFGTNKVNEVKKLLSFIGNRQSDEIGMSHLDSKCVYAKLSKMGAPIHKPHSELWFLPDKDLYDNDAYCKEGICKNLKVKKDNSQDEDDEENYGLPNIEPLTRGLAFLLMENNYFKEYYNVLIVHNTKTEYIINGVKQTSDNIFGTVGPIYHDIGESLSETIKRIETNTFKDNKSLIILTGAKLRLGISLPCADIAFNFDNISSIDNNYQTMFRVLTERTYQPKPYGYYIDFNKDRAINFLYEYNNTYGTGKKIMDFKTKTEYLHSLLIMFNYNGLGLIKQETTSQLKLYKKLIDDLKLEESSYQKFNLSKSNIESMIKKACLNINLKLLEELKTIMNISDTKSSKRNIKWIGIEGQKKGTTKNTAIEEEEEEEEEGQQGEGEEHDEGEGEEEGEEEDDNTLLINTIAEILPSIVALLALFSDKSNYNCETLEECIVNCMNNLDTLTELCSCNEIDKSSVFACYMNYSSKLPYTKDKLQKLLRKIIDIINSSGAEQLQINLNIIFTNIKDSMGRSENPLIFDMSSEEIQKKIEQYLPVRQIEKDKFGEVFTPTNLIEEMLDKLPAKVWSNPDLKWLDPANGIGNFPMVAYQKLMKGLEKWESNPKKLSEHIIEKMIYMVELNPTNVKISRKIFGSNANIYCGDFLEDTDKCLKQFNVEKFDIIMGNPPFQTPKKETTGTTAGRGTLWDKFIVKSLDILNSKGILCFITPPPWRKPENKLYPLMTQDNQLLHLHIIGEKQGQQLFNVSQRFDLYIIEKTPKYKNTEITDELDDKVELDLSKWAFLPNYNYNNLKKIMTNVEDGIDVIYNTFYHSSKNMDKTKPNETSQYKHPIVHGITLDGLQLIYSKDNTKGQFGVSKVLLNVNRNQYPVNDYEGKYGMSELTFGIPITSKKQGDDIVKAINTDEFKTIIKATKWGAFQTDYRMFKYFKPDFYKSFLTKVGKNNKGLKIKNFITKKHREGKAIKTIDRILSKKIKEKRNNKTVKTGGKNKKTRKQRSIFKLW